MTRCQYKESHWEIVNGKPKHMQCRKRARLMVAVRRFFGTRVTATGPEAVFSARNEWRCLEHLQNAHGADPSKQAVSA